MSFNIAAQAPTANICHLVLSLAPHAMKRSLRKAGLLSGHFREASAKIWNDRVLQGLFLSP